MSTRKAKIAEKEVAAEPPRADLDRQVTAVAEDSSKAVYLVDLMSKSNQKALLKTTSSVNMDMGMREGTNLGTVRQNHGVQNDERRSQ